MDANGAPALPSQFEHQFANLMVTEKLKQIACGAGRIGLLDVWECLKGYDPAGWHGVCAVEALLDHG